jgi:hypothetical protein
MNLLAVDRGAVHCGWAMFEDGRWVAVGEDTPDALFRRIRSKRADALVVEEFRLYPWATKTLIGSSLATVEVIGVLPYLAGANGIPFVTQPASIKVPTMAIAWKRAIALQSRGHSGHAHDGELRGIHHLLMHS